MYILDISQVYPGYNSGLSQVSLRSISCISQDYLTCHIGHRILYAIGDRVKVLQNQLIGSVIIIIFLFLEGLNIVKRVQFIKPIFMCTKCTKCTVYIIYESVKSLIVGEINQKIESNNARRAKMLR